MQLTGLHHVTAVTGNTAKNVEFYTQVLGLRLVKQTVNQDDISAYHLYYADERGNPGTDVTFFDWPHIGRNVSGTGTIGTIALRVSGGAALDWWAKHLNEHGIQIQYRGERAGREGILFTSPEGMQLALFDDGNAPTISQYWDKSPIPAHVVLRGLDAATVIVNQLEALALVLTQVLGFKQTREYALEGGKSSRCLRDGSGRTRDRGACRGTPTCNGRKPGYWWRPSHRVPYTQSRRTPLMARTSCRSWAWRHTCD